MEIAGKGLQLAPRLFCCGTALALFLFCNGTLWHSFYFHTRRLPAWDTEKKILRKIKKVHLKIGGQLVCI